MCKPCGGNISGAVGASGAIGSVSGVLATPVRLILHLIYQIMMTDIGSSVDFIHEHITLWYFKPMIFYPYFNSPASISN